MSTHSIPDLLHLWAKGNLTADQTIGHILQNLLVLFHWRAEVEKRLRALEQLSNNPPA